MKIVADANVVSSAAIIDGKTREVIYCGNATLLAPPELEDEVRSHLPIIVDKANLTEADAEAILDSIFAHIGSVSYEIPRSSMQKAREAIGDEDIADVRYLPTAIAVDVDGMWSDDDVFSNQ